MEFMGYSIGVDSGLLEGVLGCLVHLLGGLTAQERERLPKLRITLGKLLERGCGIYALLSHPEDILQYGAHARHVRHTARHHRGHIGHSSHHSAAFPPVRL